MQHNIKLKKQKRFSKEHTFLLLWEEILAIHDIVTIRYNHIVSSL